VSALLRRLRSEQEGFTILEVVIAMSVLAMASIGFAATAATGLRLVGTSNERQTAVQVANEAMETARGTPYSGLALDSDGLVFEGAGTPDADVGGGGTTYRLEDLVLDADGTVGHRDWSEINGARFEIYRYVTWVEEEGDPQAYKRVTIAVQWAAGDARTRSVSQSTIISSNGVSWVMAPLEGGSGTPPTTSTTAPDTTTTTAPPVCGDGTAPSGSVTILAGTGANTGYTSSSTVDLSLHADDPCAPITMAFSNDAGASWSVEEPFSVSRAWPLLPGNGDRTVHVRFRDGDGNASIASATVRVDTTKPSTPGSFAAATASAPRRVVLTWTPSSDNDQLIGYRIYMKTQNGSYQNQPTGVSHPCPTTPCRWEHTGVKNKDIFTYYVVAYDAAGNESVRTSEKTVQV